MNIVVPHAKVKSAAVNFFPLDEAERKNFDKHEQRLSGIHAFLAPFRDAVDGQSHAGDPVTQVGLDRMSDMNDALRHFVCAVHQPAGGEIRAGDEIEFMPPAPATKRKALVERYVSLNEKMRSLIAIRIPGWVELAAIRAAAPNLVVWRLDLNPHLQPGDLRPGDAVDQMEGDTRIIEPVLIFSLRDSVCFTAAGKPGPKRLYEQVVKGLCRQLGGIHIEGVSLNPCSPLNGWLKLRSEAYSLKELAPARAAARFTGAKWEDPNSRETWEKATSLVREYYRAGRWPEQRGEFVFEVSEWIHARIGNEEFEGWIVEKQAERIWQNFDPQKAFGGIRRGRDRDVVGDTRTKQSTAAKRTNAQQLSQTAEKLKAAITTYRRSEGRMPSVRVLAKEAGVSPSTAQLHLHALRADPDWRMNEFARIRLHMKCFWKEHSRRPTAKEIAAATGHAASFVDEFFAERGPDPELESAVPIRCSYSETYNNRISVDEIDRPVAAITDAACRRVDPDPGREMRLIDREKTRQGVEDYIQGQLHRGAASSLELRVPEGLKAPENLAWWLDSAARAPRRPEQTGESWPFRPKRGPRGYIYVDWRGSPVRACDEQGDLFGYESPDDELRREILQDFRDKHRMFEFVVLRAAAQRGLSSDQLVRAATSFGEWLADADMRRGDGKRYQPWSDTGHLFSLHIETMALPPAEAAPAAPISTKEKRQILGRFELHKKIAMVAVGDLVKRLPSVTPAWIAEIQAGRRRPRLNPALDYALFVVEYMRRPDADSNCTSNSMPPHPAPWLRRHRQGPGVRGFDFPDRRSCRKCIAQRVNGLVRQVRQIIGPHVQFPCEITTDRRDDSFKMLWTRVLDAHHTKAAQQRLGQRIQIVCRCNPRHFAQIGILQQTLVKVAPSALLLSHVQERLIYVPRFMTPGLVDLVNDDERVRDPVPMH